MKKDTRIYPQNVLGCMDMSKVARQIGDLRYDKNLELFRELSMVYAEQSLTDGEAGRVKLAEMLKELSIGLGDLSQKMSEIWELSRRHMTDIK
ncbi:MAG: hypothetical protein WCO30_02475 [bacterium]